MHEIKNGATAPCYYTVIAFHVRREDLAANWDVNAITDDQLKDLAGSMRIWLQRELWALVGLGDGFTIDAVGKSISVSSDNFIQRMPPSRLRERFESEVIEEQLTCRIADLVISGADLDSILGFPLSSLLPTQQMQGIAENIGRQILYGNFRKAKSYSPSPLEEAYGTEEDQCIEQIVGWRHKWETLLRAADDVTPACRCGRFGNDLRTNTSAAEHLDEIPGLDGRKLVSLLWDRIEQLKQGHRPAKLLSPGIRCLWSPGVHGHSPFGRTCLEIQTTAARLGAGGIPVDEWGKQTFDYVLAAFKLFDVWDDVRQFSSMVGVPRMHDEKDSSSTVSE
jgi:hypothetical protein